MTWDNKDTMNISCGALIRHLPATLDNVDISIKTNMDEQNRKNTGGLKLHELLFSTTFFGSHS